MKRRLAILLMAFFLAVPSARATLTFNVTQDLTGLNTVTGPLYFNWTLNSQDNVFGNNFYTVSNFTLTNVTTAPGAITSGQTGFTYTAGGIIPNAMGSVNTAFIPGAPYNPPTPTIFLGEDLTATNFTNSAWQLFTVGAGPASIEFTVSVTENYDSAGGTLGPDTFQFNIWYGDYLANGNTDPSDAIPLFTTGSPGNDSLVFLEIVPNMLYDAVQSFGGVPGGQFDPAFNGTALSNLTAPAVNPEPGTMAVWGLTLSGLGVYLRRRKQAAAA